MSEEIEALRAELERLRSVMAQVASDLEAGHERRDAAIDLVSAAAPGGRCPVVRSRCMKDAGHAGFCVFEEERR